MNDFEIMSIMSKDNKDIRCAIDVLEFKKVKQGGEITFAIDHKTANDLVPQILLEGEQKYYCIAYILNKEQFDKIKTNEK